MNQFDINVFYDTDAQVWIGTCDHLKGFVVESSTEEQFLTDVANVFVSVLSHTRGDMILGNIELCLQEPQVLYTPFSAIEEQACEKIIPEDSGISLQYAVA